jgi:UDP-N-acetylglucosamine 2-epimerase
VNTLLDDPATYATMVNRPNPFGDGTAAVQVVDCLERTLLERERALAVKATSN